MHPPQSGTAERGWEYLETLSAADRRDGGRVYTPLHVARFILDAVGYVPGAPIEAMSILDPSCGAGIFLEATLHRLAARVESVHGDLRFAQAGDAFLEAARCRLVGVDIDPDACDLARTALVQTASELTGRSLPAEYFAANVLETDFLSPDLAQPGNRLSVQPPFSVIVGNPPYVPTTRLKPAEKERLRRDFRTASGRIDLYVLFFERAVTLLRAGGRLAFVTPDKFLSSQSARPLRNLLRTAGAIQGLSRFESHKVFRGVATVPCVTLFERGTLQGPVELMRCAPEESSAGSVTVLERTQLSASVVAGDNWAAVHPDLQRLATRIRGLHRTLNECSVRVSAGIATGRDRIFVVHPDDVHGIEPELLHSAVRGRDITRFRIKDSGLRLLLPYEFRGRVPTLVDIRRYPGAHRYLAARRTELEARHCVRTWGKVWYDLHDPVLLPLTTLSKVLVPDVADRNRFAFDTGAHVPLHSAYYVLPKGIDARFLTVVLNSLPLEFLVRTTAPRVKDGFSRYRSQFLLSLPVPVPSASVARQVIRAYDRGNTEAAAEQASTLFRLTPRERATVESVLGALRTST